MLKNFFLIICVVKQQLPASRLVPLELPRQPQDKLE